MVYSKPRKKVNPAVPAAKKTAPAAVSKSFPADEPAPATGKGSPGSASFNRGAARRAVSAQIEERRQAAKKAAKKMK